jgi:steroid delta-isomerase-like uncharacterized protein
VVLIACPAWTIPCQAGEAENIEIAKSMVEAINERDLDRLDQLIAPDVVRLSAATAGVTVTSIEDFKAMLQADFAVVPDSAMTIDVIFGNGEFVAMRAIYAGTQKGQMGPFPASGKRVELPFVGILRITDGKISQMWVEWDNMHMLTQLGHMPAPTEN